MAGGPGREHHGRRALGPERGPQFREQRVVGMQHALGMRRGAGGEQDQGKVVGPQRRRGEIARSPQFVPGDAASGDVFAYDDAVLELRHIAQPLQAFEVIDAAPAVRDEQRPGAAFAQQETPPPGRRRYARWAAARPRRASPRETPRSLPPGSAPGCRPRLRGGCPAAAALPPPTGRARGGIPPRGSVCALAHGNTPPAPACGKPACAPEYGKPACARRTSRNRPPGRQAGSPASRSPVRTTPRVSRPTRALGVVKKGVRVHLSKKGVRVHLSTINPL